jgi:folate-binding protein YgfZ
MRDIVTHYTAVAQGAGFAEKAHRGRLRFDGPDALGFLQALVTADLDALAPGDRRYSTYLTPNGRMLADLTIFHRGDHLLVDAPASRTAALAARFDSIVFTEDVRVADVSAAVVQFSVIGARADDVVKGATLHTISPDAFSAPADDATMASFDVLGPAEARGRIVSALSDAGAVPMSPELMDVFRIEAGRPRFGVDMTEETIPLEAGLLDRAISTTKGCYVGQEIIVRVLHRGGGRVAKRLVKLAFDSPDTTPPPGGTPLSAGGHVVGAITSAVFSPASDRVVALGYVARDAAVESAAVDVAGHGRATIVSVI